MLQIDATDNAANVELDVIRRSGKLYDKAHHTYTFEQDIECDIVWLFDWVDLPKPIADFITARAAAITSGRIVGDTNQYQIFNKRKHLPELWLWSMNAIKVTIRSLDILELPIVTKAINPITLFIDKWHLLLNGSVRTLVAYLSNQMIRSCQDKSVSVTTDFLMQPTG